MIKRAFDWTVIAATLLLIDSGLSAAGTGMPDFQSDGRISDGTESVQMTSQGQ